MRLKQDLHAFEAELTGTRALRFSAVSLAGGAALLFLLSVFGFFVWIYLIRGLQDAIGIRVTRTRLELTRGSKRHAIEIEQLRSFRFEKGDEFSLLGVRHPQVHLVMTFANGTERVFAGLMPDPRLPELEGLVRQAMASAVHTGTAADVPAALHQARRAELS